MKKLAIALLATTVLGTPGAFAASNNNYQQPQGQQMRNQDQSKHNAQNQQGQPNGQQQSAENTQPILPDNMSRSEVRQVQQALDKDGFKAGRADGRWGHETQSAVKQFQQSKQLQATGQLDQQTVADLGLDASKFSQSQGQQK
jgi:peptidoglycan hydrolase-like protein with peptidoglycan-binding domain